jgi:hypothetical protein
LKLCGFNNISVVVVAVILAATKVDRERDNKAASIYYKEELECSHFKRETLSLAPFCIGGDVYFCWCCAPFFSYVDKNCGIQETSPAANIMARAAAAGLCCCSFQSLALMKR